MANFTPQEIEQFLQEFFDTVGARQYIGARYIPIFGRAGSDTVEWDDLAPYEPLTVVMHDGISYVSRRYVPAGIEISDTNYWVQTYRFNAQVEQYRQQVLAMQHDVDNRIPFPDPLYYPKFGVLGQVLSTLADGTVKWDDPVYVTSDIAEPLIDAWLDDHPEATTTVLDGSITRAKLSSGVETSVFFQDQLTTTDDLNSLGTTNKLFAIITGSYPANMPSAVTGTNALVIHVGKYASNQLQIMMTRTYKYYVRQYTSLDGWTDWAEFDFIKDEPVRRADLSEGVETSIFFTDTLTSSDDLNSVTGTNKLYALITGDMPANSPVSSTNAVVINIGKYASNMLQLCITRNYTYHVRQYTTLNGWTDWKSFNFLTTSSVYKSNLTSGVDGAIFFQESLGATGDLDSLGATNRLFDIVNGSYPAHMPSAVTNTNALVMHIGKYANNQLQIMMTRTYKYYVRQYTSLSGWTDWTEFGFTPQNSVSSNLAARINLGIYGAASDACIAPDAIYVTKQYSNLDHSTFIKVSSTGTNIAPTSISITKYEPEITIGGVTKKVYELTDGENHRLFCTRICYVNGYLYCALRGGSGVPQDLTVTNSYILVIDTSTMNVVKYFEYNERASTVRYFPSENIVIAGLRGGGFAVFDVTTPNNPTELYTHYQSGVSDYQNMDVYRDSDNNLCVVFGSYITGISAYVITNSGASNLFRWNNLANYGEDANCFAVACNYPYVYATIAPTNNGYASRHSVTSGILVLDVSDVSVIKEVQFVQPPINDRATYTSYVGFSSNGLVNVPTQDTAPLWVTIHNGYVYTNHGNHGIGVFKILNDKTLEYCGNIDNHVQYTKYFDISNKFIVTADAFGSGPDTYPTYLTICSTNRMY